MSRCGNFIDLYHIQKRRFETMALDLKRGHADVAHNLYNDFVKLLSGNISEKTLRKMGHPFGRGSSPQLRGPMKLMRGPSAKYKASVGHPRLIVPLLPINVQSGQLRRMSYLKRRPGFGIGQSFRMGSNAPHNVYILHPAGTKKMVGRGVFGGKMLGYSHTGEVERHFRARNKAFLDWYIRKKRA